MALVLKDRVKQTAAAPGTGTITLGATVAGFQSFSSVGNGNTTYFAIVDPISGAWEVNYGVYTSSGTTLTRNATPLSSSTGTLVNFTGAVDVFVTYPSENAVWRDTAGVVVQQSFGAITATSAALTTGTITGAPVNATDIVNKEYADSIASGLNYHQPVNYASTAALPAYTYNNGTSGVGATITANANGALSLGGGFPTATQRVLVKDEVSGNAPYNGIYVVTQAGSAGTPFILTRATDYDTSGIGTNEIDAGDYVLVISGTLASTAWVQQTPLPITVGTTAITFLQFNAPITYTAGTGLNLSPATTFNISNTGVTATTYGSASAVPVVTFNAQGQATGVTNTTIAIAGSQVSGNISGQAGSVANALTLGTYLTGGTYNGSAAVTATVDATSANTASKVVARDSSGNFSAGTITATLSGSSTSATTATNLAGGAANQIAYQSGSGTTTFATAPSASNQVLGWNGSAFSWSTGTISGVPLGSNLNSLTAGTYLTGTAYNGSAAQTWTVDATSANTASKVVARDGSGNFSAGTITASLSGNATTTSQTNFSNLTIGSSQVLYAGNYNSYAPTLTGTGASGTWGISISGNAATATNAGNATTAGGLAVNTSGRNDVANQIVRTDANGYAQMGWINSTSGVATGTPNRVYCSEDAYIRYYSMSTFTGYVQAAASGTWGINITGSAGSAPGYLPLSGGTMTGSILSTTNTIVQGFLSGASYGYLYQDGSGFGFLTYNGNWAVRVDYGANTVYIPGYAYSGSSFRAPIFYDLDNTSYYGDFAGTSSINRIAVVRSNNQVYIDYDYGYGVVGLYSSYRYQGVFAMGDAYKLPADGTTTGNLYGMTWSHPNAGGVASNLNSHGLLLLQNGGFMAALSTNGTFSADVRGTVFYDYNNTGYYVDPNSTSNLYAVQSYYYYRTAAGYGYLNGSYPSIENGGTSGPIYSIGGSYVPGSTSLGNMYGVGYTVGNISGISITGNWGFYVASGGVARHFLDSDAGIGYATGSYRAPLFYDYNNTAYYVDPASTSNIYTLNVNGGGEYYGQNHFYSYINTTGSGPGLQAYSSGGQGAVMSFHRGGYYAVNMGLDSDNIFRIGGWSAAANLLQMDMTGNLVMAGYVTAYSDERLKKDWDDLPSDFVPRLARVKSGTYTRIDNEMRQIGVGAQSLRPLMEEAVFENADGTLSVAYGNAAMASSVELARYVTALEQRISQLEARI